MGVAHDDGKNATDTSDTTAFQSSSNSDRMNDTTPSDSEKPSNSTKGLSEGSSSNEYPTGVRLVLLAGASIMGVFLISLDQVRPPNYGQQIAVSASPLPLTLG